MIITGKIFLLTVLLALLGLPALSAGADRLTIYTVNYPLKYFAERIGGDRVVAVFPAPGDVDPAYWMPEPKTIADYQKADLILLNGAGYAQWVSKVSLPHSRMVDTSAPFRDRYITSQEAVTHSHGPEGTHAHENLAFTTWLDFSLAAEQAKTVAEAMSRKRPKWDADFRQNLASLEKDLLALDSRMKEIVTKKPDLPLVASHPVYDYLARAYGLNLRSLHWEPDRPLTIAQLAELGGLLEKHPAKSMIWEGTPTLETVSKLKTLEVGSLVFAPCGNVPGLGDFLGVMRNNVDNLAKVYK